MQRDEDVGRAAPGRDPQERIAELLKANNRFEQDARDARDVIEAMRRAKAARDAIAETRERLLTEQAEKIAALERDLAAQHTKTSRSFKFMNGAVVYGNDAGIEACEAVSKAATDGSRRERDLTVMRNERDALRGRLNTAEVEVERLRDEVNTLGLQNRNLLATAPAKPEASFGLGPHTVHGTAAAIDALASKIRVGEAAVSRAHRLEEDNRALELNRDEFKAEAAKLNSYLDEVRHERGAWRTKFDEQKKEADRWRQRARDLGARLACAITVADTIRERAVVFKGVAEGELKAGEF